MYFIVPKVFKLFETPVFIFLQPDFLIKKDVYELPTMMHKFDYTLFTYRSKDRVFL